MEWDGEPPAADLQIFEETTRDALSRNDSPDLGFDYSVNPYRGCFHACAYCYARPSHPFLGWGAGTDFDRRIVVKTNVHERLRVAFESRAWRGDVIAFSGNTDCYQPVEQVYQLTRRCLEVCLEFRNPVAVVTKSKLVRRDADLLARLAADARCSVAISVGFSDDAMARRIEPHASPPSKRFATLRALADAGVPTHALVAPVIPGLNDAQTPEILARAAEAGARSASMILLRLPGEVLPVFDERLREAYPGMHRRVFSSIRQMRAGALDDPRFGERMRGRGPRYDAVAALFEEHRRRLGLEPPERPEPEPTTFVRPGAQLSLF